jgi:hypothetical protein
MKDITYRGLTLARPDYLVTVREGFEGSTARIGADREQPRGDGGLPGNHYLEPRFPRMSGLLCRSELLPTLLAAFQPSRRIEHPLSWTNDDGDERLVYARTVSTEVPRDNAPPGWQRATIALKASDPRIYGPRHVVRVEPFAVVEGGLDYPIVNYPKDFKPDVTTTAVASNVGDSDAHPTVRIHGPVSGTTTSWRLRNTTNGSELQVDTALGPGQLLTVRLREWIVADPAALIVELDGASRYGAWVTRPEVLWLSPGDNTLRLDILTGDLPSAAEVIFRDTFSGTRRDLQE